MAITWEAMIDDFNLIIALPHSGRDLSFAKQLGCTKWDESMHQSFADPHLDCLIPYFQSLTEHIIYHEVARSLVDTNRCPADIPPKLVEGHSKNLCSCKGNLHREQIGLGLLPKRNAKGALLPRTIEHEAVKVAQHIHHTYHDKLATKITQCISKPRIILELHSMPDKAAPNVGFCLGTRQGQSSDTTITQALCRGLQQSYPKTPMSIDTPFAGLYSAAQHGQPREKTHFIQLEVNRKLIGVKPNEIKQHGTLLSDALGLMAELLENR
ncbi:MAG: hypothetical protein EBT20_00780 [Alphaproteobacteria bacterium]|nr:hypothetical protein [Alphaproteobacteria bacterium]